MSLGLRLRRILSEQNLRQVDFAKALGISSNYVNLLVNDKRTSISEALAKLIENRYGYCAQWVLYGTGEPISKMEGSVLVEYDAEKLLSELEEISADYGDVGAYIRGVAFGAELVKAMRGNDEGCECSTLLNITNNVNARIRELRHALNISQVKFSEAISISSGYLAAIELCNRMPNERIIRLICLTFNVREDWLKNGEGEMFEEQPNQLLDVAFETFQELKPKYQDYILKQIDMLLEIQKNEINAMT